MIGPADLKDFADAIERRFGHGQDNGRYHDLAQLLEGRVAATGRRDYPSYRVLLAHSEQEWEALAPLLTVPETYFFRLPDQFEALAAEVVPVLLRARHAERTLRILSAGCASGEEPYSIRILLNERFPQLAAAATDWQVTIDGFDLSQPALDRAHLARYSEWSLRATSPERRSQNFVPLGGRGKLFQLLPHARAGVSLFRRNLLDPFPREAPRYDVIFCRNVLIYLSPDAIERAISCLTEQLAPGGYLFLGPAESLRGLTRNFTLCQSHDVFYYRRRGRASATRQESSADTVWGRMPTEASSGADERKSLPAVLPAVPHVLPAVPSVPLAMTSVPWFEAIQSSAERLELLTSATRPAKTPVRSAPPKARSAKPREATSPQPGANPAQVHPYERALGLIRGNRLGDALELLDESDAPDPPARLLRAALLTQLGRYDEAEPECTLLLHADDSNAGAHFIAGLCREQAGELAEADRHMRQATYLDPGFALPQLHRALLARRLGDLAAARAAFGRALNALSQGDRDRIALFGGGLTPESLRALCLRELARLDKEA